MIGNVIRLFLDYFVLSSASALASRVMACRGFPWRLWGVKVQSGFRCTGPVKISDGLPKSIGRNFLCIGQLLLGGRVIIGDNVALNQNVFIVGGEGKLIKIGNNVLIGPNVVLRSSDHRFTDVDTPIRLQGHNEGEITIEDDVWLGANVVVTKDVRIGRGCVIGAGSIVTRDLPPNSIAVGVPARVVSSRGGLNV